MGTRAAFWVGDPRDLENREWLGCIAWDGYPDGPMPKNLEGCDTLDEYREIVHGIKHEDESFADPEQGWPFPWADDVFLTDFTYAFIDGRVMVAEFHREFIPYDEYNGELGDESEEELSTRGVAAPSDYNSGQPDSIILIGSV